MDKFSSNLDLRIDWSELDIFGHVNNVTFFKYIQASRINYWKQISLLDYFKENNIGPMLVSCKCDFKKPLFFPGNITVKAKLDFIKNTSFGLIHHIFNDKNELVAEANDVVVMFDFNKNEKLVIPEQFRNLIVEIES